MPEVTPVKPPEQRDIVVVEDDQALLHLVQKNLLRAGLQTEGFSDWQQALSRVTTSPPLLLLLDYQLQGLTGKEFVEKLKGNGALPPFIIMTGHGNETIAVEMMKVGARDYMVKNTAFLDLLPTVVQQTVKSLEVEAKLQRSEEERAKLEEQLRQSQKMEAIGTLAGGIAHDFNNILTAVFGYADLAMQYIPEENPAKAMVGEVLKASNRAKELVRQILAFSRKSSQDRCAIQLHLLVKETLKLLRASIPATIEIRQEISSESGYVTADPTQLHQVMMNLCTNAAQAMEEKGGVLAVLLTRVALRAEDLAGEPDLMPGPYLKLSVRDTGVGIAPEIMDKIFDPYFTTKSVGKGSGMGLAVVHGIVKKNGGMIRVHSQSGHGATFEVFLPVTMEAVEVDPATDEAIPLGRGHILFVDDEETIASMAQGLLPTLGYTTTTLTDSSKALELFRSQPDQFDLVITDQTMPRMTGEQLACALITIRPDIPIILCTGYSPQIDGAKARAAGIKAFLMKPFEKKELAQTILRLLPSKTPSSHEAG